MNPIFTKRTLLALLPVFASATSSAHVSYRDRNFGAFSGITPQSVTILGQVISSNYGWADGADEDFGDHHKTRVFRFTLEDTAWVTISALASANGDTVLGTLLPGFSVYAGLAHLPPAMLDHDYSPITQSYLATLSGPAKEGAFNALDTFKMGSDEGTTFADLSTFAFRGYAVDGSPANFGSVPRVTGDGTADGFTSGTFLLEAGSYSIFVGGANYAGQAPTPDTGSYGISTTVSVAPVPEPSAAMLLGAGLLPLLTVRVRRAKASL